MASTAVRAAVGLVLTIVLAGLGLFAAIWRYDAPRRFAGVTRSGGAAAAPFEPPADEGLPTRAEIQRLLRSRDFAALTNLVDAKQALVERDIRNESELHRVINSFGSADPTLAPIIDDWVAASPDSVAPNIASARYLFARAYAERGTKFAADTSREQVIGMNHFLEKVVLDAGTALARAPRLTEGYAVLIDVSRMTGAQRACGEIAREGLSVAPASMRIRWALALCRLPRWGGSHEAVQAIWDQAKPFVADHPALAALGGVVSWDLGRSADGEDALRHLEAALAAGPHSAFFLSRAREYIDTKKIDSALEDATNGLAWAPEDPDLLAIRFRSLAGLGRFTEAQTTLDLLAEVDTTHADVPQWREYMQKQQAAAKADSTGGHYSRGHQHLRAGDQRRALAEFEAAVRRDPAHFDACLSIDQLLAPRREWDAIIGHWTNYLAAQPGDARAYLERAGANSWKGDMTAARADLTKACELGSEKACGMVKSPGRQ
jgi:tetratricopeptide (TPR) repeat protein